jgi:hypothetical protein
VEANEDEQAVLGKHEDLGHGLERDVGGAVGRGSVEDVGVAPGVGIAGLVNPSAQVARKSPPGWILG